MKVRDLAVEFRSKRGTLSAVNHVSFDVFSGEVLGIVGESGCGKSTLALSMLGLIGELGGVIQSGEVIVGGTDILSLPPKQRMGMRGRVLSLVFQNPTTSFNPVWSVGAQLVESIRANAPRMSRNEARNRAEELLRRVGIPNARECLDQLPSQFSGGMLQRAMIAIAIAHKPSVIVADEPTTALDVTIQKEILALFQAIVEEAGIALIIVTHDLGVIAEIADRVMVLYAGKIVELGDVVSIFESPHHPYTADLLTSRPNLQQGLGGKRLTVIPGSPPLLEALPSGCAFHPRCAVSAGRSRCVTDVPDLERTGPSHWSACHFHGDLGAGDRTAPFAAGEGA